MKHTVVGYLIAFAASAVFGAECDDAIDQRGLNECEYRVAQQQDLALQKTYESLSPAN